MKKNTLLSWSSGKDSAWALHLLRQDPTIDLLGLFTVMNQKYSRVSMHATRLEMLRRQAKGADLPLQTINLPDPCTNEQCDAAMRKFVTEYATKGVQCMAFGDLFLEDVRNYRENQLKGTGIEPLFPLWGIPTGQLAEQMLSAGLEAYISSVDLKEIAISLCRTQVGKRLDCGVSSRHRPLWGEWRYSHGSCGRPHVSQTDPSQCWRDY
jgi:diphthamide synthase (EF-2-diphthine--ammonia ligase)